MHTKVSLEVSPPAILQSLKFNFMIETILAYLLGSSPSIPPQSSETGMSKKPPSSLESWPVYQPPSSVEFPQDLVKQREHCASQVLLGKYNSAVKMKFFFK